MENEEILSLESLNEHCKKMGVFQNENTLLTRALAVLMLSKGLITNVELQETVDGLLAEAAKDAGISDAD